MCDMQDIPTEDASCEEEQDMNFAAFSAVGGGGPHFVTTSGQMAVGKLQQTANLQQVVGMVGSDGNVQYVRAVDGNAQGSPHLISVPIALPGAKPGDPPSTVQIQVLSPSVVQQQPKYQMQIPIQGFQQGGAVLTVAYSPETGEASGLHLLGNTLSEGEPNNRIKTESGQPSQFRIKTESGIQVVTTLPPEMQMVQPQQTHHDKDHHQSVQHQVFISPNQQIIINKLSPDGKVINNNTSSNNNNTTLGDIVIKEECDDNTNDEESSQGTVTSDSVSWGAVAVDCPGREELVKYLHTLPPQQAQQLPPALRQFLKLNPADTKPIPHIEIEVSTMAESEGGDPLEGNDGSMEEDSQLLVAKKKKKYKKKPPRPARPKPGQVVIAQAADGTPVFCCPECQMAYQDKEQLEMHLIVHKIERRYICGICGAGLKRKEHLERHKLGHNPSRPFVCSVCNKGFKRREHLNLHTVIHSGVKGEVCRECGKGFYRKDHLRKHTRSHEHRRMKEENNPQLQPMQVTEVPASDVDIKPDISNTILPEITIHVPTSSNMNVPVQINIPQHVVSSLAAAQQQQRQQQQQQQQSNLDALLAHHS